MVLLAKAPKKRVRFVARPIPGFWTDVHLAAERFHAPMAAAFRKAMEQAARGMSEDKLTALLRAGHVGEAVKLFDKPMVQAAYEELVLPLEYEIMAAAARAAVPTVPGGQEFVPTAKQAKPPDKSFRVTAWFDLTNPEAIKVAALLAADAVTVVTKNTQLALREVVRQAQLQGWGIREQSRLIAQELKRAAAHGLTKPQTATLGRLQETWRDSGLSEGRIKELSTDARVRMRNQRARVIARHETLEASNAGVDELWRQAEEQRLLPKGVLREWVTQMPLDERNPCKICRPMDGQKRKRGEAFVSPYNGASTLRPGIHVQCVCILTLVLD